MLTQECYIVHAQLLVAKNGNAVLYLHTKNDKQVKVMLPTYLAEVVRCLIERHQQFDTIVEREIGSFVDAKELAKLMGLNLSYIYDVKSYICRIRNIIHQAALDMGIPPEELQDFILSKRSWGYAIHPDVSVSLKMV